jgi:hypothetical protein
LAALADRERKEVVVLIQDELTRAKVHPAQILLELAGAYPLPRCLR